MFIRCASISLIPTLFPTECRDTAVSLCGDGEYRQATAHAGAIGGVCRFGRVEALATSIDHNHVTPIFAESTSRFVHGFATGLNSSTIAVIG